MANRVVMDDEGLYELTRAPGNPIDEWMGHQAFKVLSAAEALVPVASGRLLMSLAVERVDYPTYTAWRIGSTDVAYSTVVEIGDPTNAKYPVQPYLRPALQVVGGRGVVATRGGRRV